MKKQIMDLSEEYIKKVKNACFDLESFLALDARKFWSDSCDELGVANKEEFLKKVFNE